MANVLVWNALRGEIHGALCLDEANELASDGNNVYLLDCDESIGGCYFNRLFEKAQCRTCVLTDRMQRRKKIDSKINILEAKKLIREFKIDLSFQEFKFSTIEELRAIQYKNVNIGTGFYSSYIDYTRNPEPQINEVFRKYANRHLSQARIITDLIEAIIYKFEIKKIVFCNGRLSQLKPAHDLAEAFGLDYTSVEIKGQTGDIITKDYRQNTTQHDAKAFLEACERDWTNSKLTEAEKVSLGKSFFENRRSKKIAGDKIYTLNQQENLMPENWNEKIENIVIFNSSEDEFAALGGDYIRKSIYKTQIEGILDIVNHYKDDPTKHFYLRVHPNLMNIDKPYHTDLYKLRHKNLTVIPADSPVSTYSLIDNSDKIIVFGSTTGIEGAYAGKPVITLRYAMYYYMDVVYIPKSRLELWTLIDEKKLMPKFNDNVYKFGFEIMSTEGYETKYFNIQYKSVRLLNKNYKVYRFQKILGNFCIPIIIKKLGRIISGLKKETLFNAIPND